MAEANSTARHWRIKEEVGNVYGKLTVLEFLPNYHNTGRAAYWRCLCECGNVVAVNGGELRSGKIRTCSKRCGHTTHGHAGRGKQTPEYRCWRDILRRCYDPGFKSYHNYGGRGVVMCNRWKDSFAAFFRDVGPRPSVKHSIDRIDNNGNYESANCRWATKSIQDNNRRTNHLITFNGVTKTLTQWAATLGIQPTTLYFRLTKLHWTLKKAMTTPKLH